MGIKTTIRPFRRVAVPQELMEWSMEGKEKL